MKLQTATKYVLIVSVVAIGLASIFSTRGQNQDPQPRSSAEEEHRLVVEAMRRGGGIKEAARIKGNYVLSTLVRAGGIYADLEALASHSDVVIVGTPYRNVCQVTPEGDSITTNYDVAVQEVFKGKVKQKGTITVSLPGGRVQFEDGTSAEIRVPDFRKMENGKTYVLFLSEQKNRLGFFQVVGGPQGLFELSADNVAVKSHGRSIDRVAKKYKDTDQKSFLHEVREATKKWPKESVCCD